MDYLSLWYSGLDDSFVLADFWPQHYYGYIEIINEFLNDDYD